jgi:hypothetical protein
MHSGRDSYQMFYLNDESIYEPVDLVISFTPM